MKKWKLILVGGFFVVVFGKILLIPPAGKKFENVSRDGAVPSSKSASEGRTITVYQDDSGEVTMSDQNGREVTMNEIMQWKPEVELE